jgi:hypothetical protein
MGNILVICVIHHFPVSFQFLRDADTDDRVTEAPVITDTPWQFSVLISG